jgi:hypothetical protein
LVGDSPKTPSQPKIKSKSNTGVIAGGVVGAVVAIALGVGVFMWYRRCKRRKLEEQYQLGYVSQRQSAYEKPMLASYIPEQTESVEAYGYPVARSADLDVGTGLPELGGGPTVSELPGRESSKHT